MTARIDAPRVSLSASASPHVRLVGILRSLLLLESVLAIGLAVLLSLLAAGLRSSLAGELGVTAEMNVRFAAGAAILFAIFAAIAARGARRRRSWAWTMGAILQVLLAVGTGIAVLVAEWHPAYLAGFGLATGVMLVLSAPSVRRSLGQA